MGTIDLLVIGPASQSTGGIARFLSEQRRRLPEGLSVRTYDNGAIAGSTPGAILRALVISVIAMLRFPLERPADVIHVHTAHRFAFYRASWYVFVAGMLWRVPVVVHIHGSSFDGFIESKSPLAAAAQRLTFGLSDRVIVLSDGWRATLSGRVDESKLVVVPNAVDPTEYDPRYGADPPVVAFISNHIERKGIREFVAAVDRLATDGLQVRIAGEGPLDPLAADLANRSPNVEYLGYVSEEEKRRVIGEATLYALPTYSEGLPIALLEGMAGGNAVLTTDVDAIPEVVDADSGWVVPPGDVDELVNALQEFAAAPEACVEMGRHNRAIVEQRYAWPVVTDRLAKVYRSVAAAEDDERPDGSRSSDQITGS